MYYKNSQYLTKCNTCGRTTTKKHARLHNGLCKACVDGIESINPDTPTREQRVLDAGWQAYAREEGHYDSGE